MELSPQVVETVMQISKGDMRKVINLFQSIYLQYSASSDDTNKIELEGGIGINCSVKDVYRITGLLPPKTIEAVFQSMLNDDFENCRKTVKGILKNSDANIASLVPYLTDLILDFLHGEKQKLLKIELLCILQDIEEKSSRDVGEELLLDYLISQFYIARCE